MTFVICIGAALIRFGIVAEGWLGFHLIYVGGLVVFTCILTVFAKFMNEFDPKNSFERFVRTFAFVTMVIISFILSILSGLFLEGQ